MASRPDALTRPFTERTAWARNLAAPVRDFLQTESAGALALLCAAVAALVWANSPWSGSYEDLWSTTLSIRLGGDGISMDLRQWVNEGLMTLFFLVVGLEARREFDLGALRERSRIALPLLGALGGMALAVAIYLAFNAGGDGAGGWGAAMSTDTAFALGVLALVAPGATRLRVRLLTLVVIDDIVALLVITTVYTEEVDVAALVLASRSSVSCSRFAGRPWHGAGPLPASSAWRSGWRFTSPASTRWWPGSQSASPSAPIRRHAATSSASPSWRARSASSRRRSWPAPLSSEYGGMQAFEADLASAQTAAADLRSRVTESRTDSLRSSASIAPAPSGKRPSASSASAGRRDPQAPTSRSRR